MTAAAQTYCRLPIADGPVSDRTWYKAPLAWQGGGQIDVPEDRGPIADAEVCGDVRAGALMQLDQRQESARRRLWRVDQTVLRPAVWQNP